MYAIPDIRRLHKSTQVVQCRHHWTAQKAVPGLTGIDSHKGKSMASGIMERLSCEDLQSKTLAKLQLVFRATSGNALRSECRHDTCSQKLKDKSVKLSPDESDGRARKKS